MPWYGVLCSAALVFSFSWFDLLILCAQLAFVPCFSVLCLFWLLFSVSSVLSCPDSQLHYHTCFLVNYPQLQSLTHGLPHCIFPFLQSLPDPRHNHLMLTPPCPVHFPLYLRLALCLYFESFSSLHSPPVTVGPFNIHSQLWTGWEAGYTLDRSHSHTHFWRQFSVTS